MQKTKRFGKDFILVIIGQIISLFGNAVLRFALPLYLFDQTGSPTLLGLVSAGSFLPMVVLSPVGGIVADRVNKRNIMVVLDFSTAALIALFALALGRMPLVPLLMAVLLLLYGIQGAYQPAVQASIPLLAAPEQLMPANAAVNMVSSLASLVGPVLGGVLYSWNGLRPILYVSCACFVFSAVMETFIRIPHASRGDGGSIWRVAQKDMARSLRYIFREKPVVGRIILLVCAFNLFMSSMLIIGLPVILRQTLAVDTLRYGLSQGALAAGGLAGGILAGVLGERLDIRRAHFLLLGCALGILPMGLSLALAPASAGYVVVAVCSFMLMVLSTLFSVQMMAFVQSQTPGELVGKVISCLLALSMCAQPIGQAMYGVMFEQCPAWLVVCGASGVSALVALASRAAFRSLR